MNVFARVMLATGLFWVLGWSAIVWKYGGEATAPIGFGCYSTEACFAEENRELLPESALVYDSGGYDGQFYYYIAAAMAGGKTAILDFPVFRLARIGYPLLVIPGATAGPGGLVLAMGLVPFAFHLLSIFLFYRFLKMMDRFHPLPSIHIATAIYAINPVSLKSFLLMVSDGVALSAGVGGISLFFLALYTPGLSRGRVFAGVTLAFILLALSLLSKETLLAIPAGFLGGEILSSWKRGEWIPVQRQTWNRILFFMAVLLVLPVWWILIGFHPGMAGERGGFPMAGLFGYLANPDSILSGRSLLVALLFIYFSVAGKLMREGLGLPSIQKRTPADRFSDLNLSFSISLFLTIFLISFATADEYWGNFANIVRIYGPGIFGLAWFAASGRVGRAWFPLVFLGIFSLLLVASEWKGKKLPTRVMVTKRVVAMLETGKKVPNQDSSSISL